MAIDPYSHRVETLIANDDPATQQSDMDAVTSLLQGLPPDDLARVTQNTLQGLSIDDKSELFSRFAKRLSAEQLVAVARGLNADPGQPADLEDTRPLADIGDLANAVNTFSDPDKRLRFQALSQQRRVMEPAPERPRVSSGDAAIDARQAFIESKLTPDKRDNRMWHYKLFMQKPELMAQPIINAHYREFGVGALRLDGRTHVSNVVGLATGARLKPDVDLADPARAQGRMRAENLFEPRDDNGTSQFLTDKIVDLGGNNPSVEILPMAIGIPDAEHGGVLKSVLFKVALADGSGSRIVDMKGRDYASLGDFRRNNTLPVEGVSMVIPAGGRPELDAAGNVKLGVVDAREEGNFEALRRVTHADTVAMGAGLAGLAWVTAGQIGWVAAGTSGTMMAQGAMTGATAYSIVAGSSTLADDLRHGENFDPTENPRPALNAASTLLGGASLLRMGTLGIAEELAQQSNRAFSRALMYDLQGQASLADAHMARAVTLAQRAEGPLNVGKSVFTRKVDLGLTAAHAGVLAPTGHSLWNNWDQLSSTERLSHGLNLTLGTVGVVSSGMRLMKDRVPAAAPAETLPPPRTPSALPTTSGPVPHFSSANASGSVLIKPIELVLGGGEQFRQFGSTGHPTRTPIPEGQIRVATWFKAGDVPNEVKSAYASLLRQRHPTMSTEEALGSLEDKHLLVITQGVHNGPQELLGGATLQTDFRGHRTLSFGDIDTHMSVRRDGGGERLQKGDAYLTATMREGIESEVAAAALEGATRFTDARRVLWSTTHAGAQVGFDQLSKDPAFAGAHRSYSVLRSNATALVEATPENKRTPGQTQALAQATERERLRALSDLTALPNGAREVGYEFPINRPLTPVERVYKVTSPDSYLGRFNAALNPVGRAVDFGKYLQQRFAKPETLRTWPAREGTGERTAMMYPPGTMSQAQAYEQAQRVIDANKTLPGSPYATASVGEVAEQLDKLYVVRVTETSFDGAGQPIPKLVGGGSVKPRWGGTDANGRWLNAELPPDAAYLSHVFGAKGGGPQATEASKDVAQRLHASELDFYTRWPGAQAMYARLNVPVVDSRFTPEAPALLLAADKATLARLPNPVRAAVISARQQPTLEAQAKSLGEALAEIERVDFQTTFTASQKLYASVAGRDGKFAPDAASTLLKADPAAVDGLPPPIRDAVAAARALPAARQSGELQTSLGGIELAKTPMLGLPDGVLKLSYRQPIEVSQNWASNWIDSAWKWTNGTLRGRPTQPEEIQTFPKQGATQGVDRRAVLHPPGTLNAEQLHEQAHLVREMNNVLPNSPYARITTQQLADKLKELYVVQIRDQSGKLLGGAALEPSWKGPTGDGRWLDSSVPPNTTYLSHVFGNRGAGEQATLAAQRAAGTMLTSGNLAFYTRWQGAQALYSKLNTNTVDVRFTPLAPDILLSAGPNVVAKLPADVREAVTTARALPVAQQRPHLREWLDGLNASDYQAKLPNGVLRVSYLQPIEPETGPYRTLVGGAREAYHNFVAPAARNMTLAAGRVNEAVNPFGGPEGIQPGPVRQTLRDSYNVARDLRDTGFKYVGGTLAAANVAQLLAGQAVVHENDDRATAPFNALPGSSSYSIHFPWTSTTLSTWHSGPAWRGIIGASDSPGMPMARVGPAPGDPSGPSSATAVVPARANLGELGLGLQIGNNELAWRGTGVLRFANTAFNLRGDLPLDQGSAKGFSMLTSLTPVQPSLTTGLYVGAGGVVDRDMQLILGPALQLQRLNWSAASKASYLFADDHGHVGGKVGSSQGYFLTLNPAHGLPEPQWHKPQTPTREQRP